jgi:outer membrane receptor protein involved in Fe transport
MGLDVKADVRRRWTGGAAALTARYSFQRALDHTAPGSQTYGNQIPYIPLHSGGMDLEVQWGDWTFSWDTVLTGARWSRTANTPDYYVAPWTVSDASLFRKMEMPALSGRAKVPELRAGIVCGNVFNTSYQIVQGYPMPGFHAMLSVEYAW